MIGRKLSHYSIVAKIGAGGMGEVYRAEDLRLHRDVALKLLPQDLAGDPERLQRFRREAEFLAALDHPNIVTVYSVEEDDGTHFLTMAFVDGVSLEDELHKGRLDRKRFFEIAEPLADALAAAHEKGITHRDLKPTNVMISKEGRLKVLDFGLAKLQSSTVSDDTALATRTLTRQGSVMGTLPYMSPEQLQGRTVDHRSDIFSLGAVLYEMAAGTRPFEGESDAMLASAILRDDPATLEALRQDLPQHLLRIISQCLEKDPADRFQTARDVYNQIRSLRRESESGTASSSAHAFDPPRTRGKHSLRIAAAVASVAVLAGLAGWLGARFAGDRPDQEASQVAIAAAGTELSRLAVLPFQNVGAPEDEYFAAGVTDEISSRLAGVEGLSLRSRSSVLQYDRSGKAIPQVGEELGVAFVLDGTVRWAASEDAASRVLITPQLIRVADDTTIWSQNYERTLEDIFAVQSEIAENVADALGLTLLDSGREATAARGTTDPDAYRDYLRGRAALAQAQSFHRKEELELAASFFENALVLDPNFALAHAQLATTHAFQSYWYFDRTEERLDSVKTHAENALLLAPDLPEARLALAYYHRGHFDYDRALDQLELARRARPGDADILAAMAELYWYKGDTDEATAAYSRASAIEPQRGELYCMRGGAHRMAWENEIARQLHEKAIDLIPQRSCPYFCLAYLELNAGGVEAARAYLESIPLTTGGLPPTDLPRHLVDTIQGRFEEALARLDAGEEALTWQQFFYPRSLLRAQVLGLMGRQDDARPEYESARADIEELLEKRPTDERLYSSLGLALAGLGREQEAIENGLLGVEMLPIQTDRFSGSHRLKDLALTYVLLGRYDEAVDSLEQIFAGPSEIHIPEIRLDPLFGPLLDHPRFRSLRHDGHDCASV